MSKKLRLWLSGAWLVLLVLGLSPAYASSANISHSYRSDKPIANGSVVSLSQRDGDYVEPANTNNGRNVIGLVLDSSDSLVAVDAQTGRVQVATSGTASMLVSTLNGSVAIGDQIGVSPFNGIGAKAIDDVRIVGLAQTALDDHTPGVTKQTVTDTKGHSKQIAVGIVRISIAIGPPGNGKSGSSNAPQQLVKSVTGKKVSTVQAVMILLVALVTIVALVVLIYGSIYGSIISIGRNPLARYAVFRTLAGVLAMAIAMVGTAVLTIYLLLR